MGKLIQCFITFLKGQKQFTVTDPFKHLHTHTFTHTHKPPHAHTDGDSAAEPGAMWGPVSGPWTLPHMDGQGGNLTCDPLIRGRPLYLCES